MLFVIFVCRYPTVSCGLFFFFVFLFFFCFSFFFFKQKTAYEIKECDWSSDVCSSDLLIPVPKYNKARGTLKYGSQWNIFDQAIVSQPLLKKTNKLGIVNNKAHVFDAGFLLEKDEKNLGIKLNRTYSGFKYIGGYSDHLPVYIDIYSPNQK